MKTTYILFGFLWMSCFMGVSAQTAKEIIDKNLEKTGGYKNWNKLNSIQLTGEAVLGVTDTYPITIIQKRPNLTKTTMTIDGKAVVLESYNGKEAYKTNMTTGKKEKIEDYQAQSFEQDHVNYENKGFTAEYLGKEKVNNTECFKVKLTKNTASITYYFSTTTYYMLKEVRIDETVEYSDFRKTGNLIVPYRLSITSSDGMSDSVLKFSKIELNKVIADAKFDY